GGLTVSLSGEPLPSDTGIYFYTSPTVIHRFDSATGTTAWDYTLPQNQTAPYAASADGSLWINAEVLGELIHVGSDGKALCTFANPASRYLKAVTTDETGTAWAIYQSVNDDYATLYRIPPDAIESGACVPDRIGGDADPLTLDIKLAGNVLAGAPPAIWI